MVFLPDSQREYAAYQCGKTGKEFSECFTLNESNYVLIAIVILILLVLLAVLLKLLKK